MDNILANWQAYNVHYISNGIKHKVCFTALSKEDAKATFLKYATIEGNSYGIPFESTPTKVYGPLGVKPQSAKQHMAQQYRSCIGAACMLERNLMNVNSFSMNNMLDLGISTSAEADKRIAKIRETKSLALKQVYKCKRDIVDFFKLMGLKIK